MIEELKMIIGSNEKILYEGKPNKKCYAFETICNPKLFIALLWAIIVYEGMYLSCHFTLCTKKPLK